MVLYDLVFDATLFCPLPLDLWPLSVPPHLQSAVQRAESVHFVVDDGVLAASDERPPEVVVRERLLLARQRDSALLDVVEHHAHLVDGSCFSHRGVRHDPISIRSTADGIRSHKGLL